MSQEKAEAIWGYVVGQLPTWAIEERAPTPDEVAKVKSGIAAIIGDDWISVEDRLPDKSGSYLVTVKFNDRVRIYDYDIKTKDWSIVTDPTNITHWRERPDPAK